MCVDLLRRLLLALLDDLLDAADEELVHLVPPLVRNESGHGCRDEWKRNCTHQENTPETATLGLFCYASKTHLSNRFFILCLMKNVDTQQKI